MHDSRSVPAVTEAAGGVARKRMRLCTCPIYRTEAEPAAAAEASTASSSGCKLDELRNKQPVPPPLPNAAHGLNAIASDKQHRVPLVDGTEDHWCWDVYAKSQEVSVYGEHKRTVLFHPGWSNGPGNIGPICLTPKPKGTAAIRGTKRLNGTVSYWEIEVSHRLFGTSLMFGIGTSDAPLYENSFVNLLGRDEHSWGLSHKGDAWHGGAASSHCAPFKENQPVVVGLLFDGQAGTLSYYKNGQPLGVAFSNLHCVDKPLYPMISSTAARTEMSVGVRRRRIVSLEDRCLSMVADKFYNNCRSRRDAKSSVARLPIPASQQAKILQLLPDS